MGPQNVCKVILSPSDAYATSELYQTWLRRYILNAYFPYFLLYGQNVCCTFTCEINDDYYYYFPATEQNVFRAVNGLVLFAPTM